MLGAKFDGGEGVGVILLLLKLPPTWRVKEALLDCMVVAEEDISEMGDIMGGRSLVMVAVVVVQVEVRVTGGSSVVGVVMTSGIGAGKISSLDRRESVGLVSQELRGS